MIHSRLDGLDMDVETWVDMLPSVIRKYNNTEHSTTGLKLNEAVESSNHFELWLNINSEAKYNSRYKPIKVGDKVRTYVKPKTMKKGHDSSWSKDVFTIIFINDKQ